MALLILRSSVGSTPPPSEKFDFYISTTGSDSNDGLTPETAWAITAINTKRATYAGSRVGLLNGTYSVAGMSEVSGSIRLMLGAGTVGSPTVLQAVNARQAIIDGGGDSNLASLGIAAADAGYLEILDIVFQNTRKHAVLLYHTPNSSSNQGAGLLVEGCEFRDQTFPTGDTDFSPTLLIQGFDAPIIRNNRFHDLDSVDSSTSPAGLEMYGCRNGIIEYNSFYNIDGFGYYDKYGANGVEMQGTIIRYNYFYNCNVALAGFDNKPQTFDPPDEGPYVAYQIYNNIIESCASGLNNPGSFCADAPVLCYNNTIYNTAGAISSWNLHCRSAGREPSFYNNIVYNSGTWFDWRSVTISLDGGVAAVDVIDYNCYGPSSMSCQTHDILGYPYAAGGNYDLYTTLSAWRTACGGDAGAILDDPEFVLTGTEAARFQLGGSSPCLNAGRVGGLSGGATRHMGAWDGVVTQIGADWAEAA